jgi:hypothetical protein
LDIFLISLTPDYGGVAWHSEGDYMPEGRGLFEVARERILTRHLAYRAKQACLQWMRRYVDPAIREHLLLGHADVRTTMIYTHVKVKGAIGVKSPLDRQRHHCIVWQPGCRTLGAIGRDIAPFPLLAIP